MESLKNPSRWIKRPLLLLLCLLIPVLLLYNRYFVKEYVLPVASGSMVSFTGKVASKTYDESGNLATAMVDNAMLRFTEFTGPEPVIGSVIEVTGKVKEFDRPFNKGGFDAKAYYRARGADYSINVSKIRETEPAAFLLRERLNGLRLYTAMAVRRFCPKESGTINTLLLAEKSGLSKERKDLYKSVSLSHFLVVSGLHVSAFAGVVYRLLKGILRRRTPACAVTVVVLVLYGTLINFGVSVVRAIIMYSLRLLASVLGESYDLLSAASLAAVLTLLVNPLYLTDSAFIYSYVAVFGIGFMYEANVMKGLKGLKNKVKDAFRFSVAMGLIMLPVTLYFSGAYTLGAVILNLCIVPFGPLMLGVGFLAMLFSVLGVSPIAGFFDVVEAYLLKATDLLALGVTNLTFLRVSGKPAIVLILLYYGVLAFVFLRGKKVLPLFHRVLMVFGGLQALSAVWWWSPAVSMLYVGQGECIVLQTGPRSVAISDCGSTSKKEIFDYDLLPFLNVSGINRIDAFFLSHSDKDHCSGIEECLEGGKRSGISVNMLIMQDLKEEDKKLTELVRKADQAKVKHAFIASGDCVKLGCWDFECLWPIRGKNMSDVNSASLVLRAHSGQFSMLLTGDISEESEKNIMTRTVNNNELYENLTGIDVLKVAHHGSKTASSEEFLLAVDPKIALISAGIDNRYHHPSPIVTERLESMNIPWYCTADHGEIDVEIRGKNFAVSLYR